MTLQDTNTEHRIQPKQTFNRNSPVIRSANPTLANHQVTYACPFAPFIPFSPNSFEPFTPCTPFLFTPFAPSATAGKNPLSLHALTHLLANSPGTNLTLSNDGATFLALAVSNLTMPGGSISSPKSALRHMDIRCKAGFCCTFSPSVASSVRVASRRESQAL